MERAVEERVIYAVLNKRSMFVDDILLLLFHTRETHFCHVPPNCLVARCVPTSTCILGIASRSQLTPNIRSSSFGTQAVVMHTASVRSLTLPHRLWHDLTHAYHISRLKILTLNENFPVDFNKTT